MTQLVEPGIARADLHTHSTASDGTLAPADLVRQAHRRGLSVIALTDHDSTAGLPEAMATGAELGVRVIPGIELSTNISEGEVHILGYGIDPDDATLQAALARYRQARVARAIRIIDRLRGLGVELSEDAVLATADGASVGRPHIARAMIEAGYVGSVSEAFDRYIGNGKPAFIESERKPTPVEAIELIQAAGGLAIHAHPYTSERFPGSLAELVAAGLAGIEVYYAEYTPEQHRELARIAAEHGILAAGGSDYHGERFKERRDLGTAPLPVDVLDRFLQRLDARSASHG
jgi:predicted metal-dependent phosphoesterase TrpH